MRHTCRTSIPAVAGPGFHPAREDDPAQQFAGGWRFSPQYGADISQTAAGQAPDNVTFTFWGTDAGLRVRRANFRARLYITVDGQPANALPRDENGAVLILTSPDPAQDFMVTEQVAKNLQPGEHAMVVTAARGWDQWALNGFSVGYRPPESPFKWRIFAALTASVLLLALGFFTGRHTDWSEADVGLAARFAALNDWLQIGITALAGLIVALTGWLTWGEQLAGLYRRLGDGGQLALTAAAASVFYVTPAFFLYFLALGVLFVLIYLRPAWGSGPGRLYLSLLCATAHKTDPDLPLLSRRNFHAGNLRGLHPALGDNLGQAAQQR